MKAATHDPRFATKVEISSRLGVSIPTVKAWTARGYLKPVRQSNGGVPNVYRWSQIVDAVRRNFLRCDPVGFAAIAKEQEALKVA